MILYLALVFQSATIDMFQDDGRRIGNSVPGILQENGDFIFSLFHEGYRKMIQTTNLGTVLKVGYIGQNNENLDVVDTWNAGGYGRRNFIGSKGILSMQNIHQ